MQKRTPRSEEVQATVVEGYAAFMLHDQVCLLVQDRHGEEISNVEMRTLYNRLTPQIEKKRKENATKLQILSPLVRIAMLEDIASRGIAFGNLSAAITAIKTVNEMMPNKGKVLSEDEVEQIKAAFESSIKNLMEEEGLTRAESIALMERHSPEIMEFIS
jgi:hypothetical protein